MSQGETSGKTPAPDAASPAIESANPPFVLPKPDLPHFVVVGGGAGGLELATWLGNKLGRRKRASITLVDRSRTHVWKPLLHAIAAGSLDPDEHELEYMAQGTWHGFKFRYGEMIGLDRQAKRVHLAPTYDEDGVEITPDRWVPYDRIVIAIGSVGHDFGTPGVSENAIMLDTQGEAERFNRRLLNALVRAQSQRDPVRPGQLHVTIIGAGATGTELSAELHRTARGLVEFGLDKINPENDIEITLIEAADRILPALSEKLSTATAETLRELKVDIRTGSRVTRVRRDGVELASGEFIPSELVVWAAGVKGPAVLGNLDGLEVSRSNLLVVKPTLQTTRDDNVFAIGDCAYFVPEGETQPIAPRAQAAHQEASFVGRQLVRLLDDQPLQSFKYHDHGSLVSLGNYSTFGSLMGFIGGRKLMIAGFVARMMYRMLYKMHEYALHGFWRTFVTTISRLLSRRTEPQVKLH